MNNSLTSKHVWNKSIARVSLIIITHARRDHINLSKWSRTYRDEVMRSEVPQRLFEFSYCSYLSDPIFISVFTVYFLLLHASLCRFSVNMIPHTIKRFSLILSRKERFHVFCKDFAWFRLILLDFTWFHLISLDFTWFQWFHLISVISLDFTWFHLISLGFTWFTWFQWFHLISTDFKDFTWFHLISTWFHERVYEISKSDLPLEKYNIIQII